MKRVVFLFLAVSVAGLVSCNTLKNDSAAKREKLRDIPGLEIKGSRTRANVIGNIRPLLDHMQVIYEEHKARNAALKGGFDLRLTVDCTGEVELIQLRNNTITDEKFMKAVRRPLDFVDFDVWGEPRDETEINLPVRFGI